MCFTPRPDPDINVPPRPIFHPTSRIATIAVITPPTHSTTNGIPLTTTTLPHPRSRPRSRSETRRLSSGQLVTVETISPRASGAKIVRSSPRSPRGSGRELVNVKVTGGGSGGSPRVSGGNLVQLSGSPRVSGGSLVMREGGRKRELSTISPRESNAVVITPAKDEERAIITTPRQSGNIVHFEDEEVLVVRPVRSRGYSSSGNGVGGGWQGKSPRQSVGSVRSVSYRSTREKIVEVDVGGDRRGYERREGGRSSRG